MGLPDPLPVERLAGPFRFSFRPPGSKSLTNRAMVIGALADGKTMVRGALRADDTEAMAEAMRGLGVVVRCVNDEVGRGWERIEMEGGGGALRGGSVDARDAGTVARFCAAMGLIAENGVRVDGSARLRQRPMEELLGMLEAVGARVRREGREGEQLPVVIEGPAGGRTLGTALKVGAMRSGQFVSAMLMVAPRLPGGLMIRFDGEVTSASYVRMTIGVMRQFGAKVEHDERLSWVRVLPGGYRGREFEVEPDASSATYFLALAAITLGATATVEGLGKGSMQGDVGFVDLLAQMGSGVAFGRDFITVTGLRGSDVLHGIDVDMSEIPDAAMTLAVTALFARGATMIRGLGTLRHKESDRLTGLRDELRKFGAEVEVEDEETLAIEPGEGSGGESKPTVTVETSGDHRMAMAFAVAGARRGGVMIRNPECVGKTYPTFWDDLEALRRSASAAGGAATP